MSELEKLILKMFDTHKSLEAIKHASPEVEEALRLKDEYYATMEEIRRICGTEKQYVPYPVYPEQPVWKTPVITIGDSTKIVPFPPQATTSGVM